MTHAIILPILIPFGAAVLLLAAPSAGRRVARALSLTSALALVVVALHLLATARHGGIAVYALGDWPAPYGIVLVLDRLSALMVTLAAVIGAVALHRAAGGLDTEGRYFHPLFQLQLAGLNGAFLTGDLFNLFVFFEVLLLASYALLGHGGGLARTRAGLTYVVLNLAGSALFLMALALLYGMIGTLNLADMALRLPGVAAPDQGVVRTAWALLVVVFALKAALVPLSLWLPHAYTAASAPVAALFAIMTKVGIYSLLRISTIALDAAPFTAGLLAGWLVPLAVATILLGVVGAVAATRLRAIVANLVLVSTGVLVAGIAAPGADAGAAVLYYLVHSTVITAGLFLLAEQIARQRGQLADALVRGPALADARRLGLTYLILAVAVSGVPPLSGFLGKILLMRSVQSAPAGTLLWVAMLVSGFVVALVLARTASVLFWEVRREGIEPPGGRGSREAVSLNVLAAASLLLALGAPPIMSYARDTAGQLSARHPYLTAVLGESPRIQRERRP